MSKGQVKYILKKVLSLLITLYIVITINFFLFRIMPGNAVRLMFLDPRVSKENIDLMMKKFGLDKPLWMQYLIYIRETVSGNLGISFWKNEPVINIIMSRLPQTIILLTIAIIVSTSLGIILGAYSAWRKGSLTDSVILGLSLITYSIPSFWNGILLLLVFSFWLNLFPLGGTGSIGISHASLMEQILDFAWHSTLPLITLILYYLGGYVMIMRNSMLDVLSEDYIVAAYAKGLSDKRILWRHAVRNALLPVTTVTALNFGWMIAGVIEVEVVFSWPGVGRLVYDAIIQRDYPLLQGAFLIIAISVIIANFISDIIYGFLDPRIRKG
ncbi:ABC transporter permease [Candidatus Geothermarchaeota archaeon]|nr:MAG: ABC transporter permease [Candidatus Geothermarchaeota archaeon]HEW93136.1 ABC transporter permease [Thermoprotei archaeon]